MDRGFSQPGGSERGPWGTRRWLAFNGIEQALPELASQMRTGALATANSAAIERYLGRVLTGFPAAALDEMVVGRLRSEH